MRHILARSMPVLLALSMATSASGAPSRGLELTWANGARNIDVTSACVCTLLVRAPSSIGVLPPTWRLVYAGESGGPADSALVFLARPGPADAAPIASVEGPMTDAERLSHQTTVTFFGPGDGEPTSSAAFVVRVDPRLHARLAVVHASQADRGASESVGPSAEVTINGGSTLPYPPVVWSAHASRLPGGGSELVLQGIGLAGVRGLLVNPHGAGAQPSNTHLPISSQSANVITARLPAPLAAGASLMLYGGPDGESAVITPGAQPPVAVNSVLLDPMYPESRYFAKDFTFIYANGQFHVFYIRHRLGVPIDSTEVDFGHAVWSDSLGWTQLPPVLHVRPDNWDNLHVWAPSIIYDDSTSTYFMYYTGVTSVPYAYTWYQRIGLATSTDLMNWTRYDAPVFGGDQSSTAFADSSQFAGCQFRDPFVVADPTTDGNNWLMYYAATPQGPTHQLITHVARNARGMTPWEGLLPLWNTDFFLGGPQPHYVGYTESPHMFPYGGRWYLFFTTNSTHRINFEYADSPIADSTGWSMQYRLFNVMDQDPVTDHWYASEYLKVGHAEYFAFVNDLTNGIEFWQMQWTSPATFMLTPASVLDVPAAAGAPREATLALAENARPGAVLGVRVTLPAPMNAAVAVFDVLGRRLRTLHAGMLAAGTTSLEWNRLDDRGREVAAGVYFVRMVTPRETRLAKAVILR